MMMHPSYREMMAAVNKESEDDTTPIVSSRYSIVMATAKRARQIIDGTSLWWTMSTGGNRSLSLSMKSIREK
jgi:DNA-directed RNA polymerase subunit omega